MVLLSLLTNRLRPFDAQQANITENCAKRVRLGKKGREKNVANNSYVNCFFQIKLIKSKQSRNQRKRISIGVKFEGALPADHVYQATFKKSLENEK